MTHRGHESGADAARRHRGNRREQRRRRLGGALRERVDVVRAEHQSPGRSWMSGKNRSCHFAGGSFTVPTLPMNTAVLNTFSGDSVKA